MKLYSLSVLYKGESKTVLLKAAYDVSSFSFFQRSSVQEFMTFTSQLIVERSGKGSRASVKEQEYLCHVYVRNDSLAGVVIADSEYPSRVAFTLLEKNPREADPMTKVQAELDETKIILHNTMESLLERGEKLDDLVHLFSSVLSLSRPGNKTHAVQSCDGHQQRPLRWNVIIIHTGAAAPQEAEPPRNNPSGTDSTSTLELLGETEGWMGT
ncbi:YKT6 [Cervus elaphus hippelaphus]|uniref:YKT6 n=1 Tax=Cervus elaphus hippelaphus TaxID=46360 RepID=A0A212CLA9_CEREH|nr:YKT6 [Cervus elaphus hippelaphus]